MSRVFSLLRNYTSASSITIIFKFYIPPIPWNPFSPFYKFLRTRPCVPQITIHGGHLYLLPFSSHPSEIPVLTMKSENILKFCLLNSRVWFIHMTCKPFWFGSTLWRLPSTKHAVFPVPFLLYASKFLPEKMIGILCACISVGRSNPLVLILTSSSGLSSRSVHCFSDR